MSPQIAETQAVGGVSRQMKLLDFGTAKLLHTDARESRAIARRSAVGEGFRGFAFDAVVCLRSGEILDRMKAWFPT